MLFLVLLGFGPGFGTPVAAQFVEDVDVLQTFTAGGGSFGWAVARIRDLDGDQITDVILSAPFISRTHVYSSATGALLLNLTSATGTGNFGYAIADAGDVDGDGFHDVVVGANTEAGGGRAYLFSGQTGVRIRFHSAEAAGDSFGSAVGCAGDVNDDGLGDIIVGAELADAQGPNSGRAYIYSGGDGSLIRTLEADGTGDNFGSGVAGAGDVDGDGIQDQIIGARNAGPFNRGVAYVVSGATGSRIHELPSDPGGVTYGQFFVDGVGDVNADTVPDLYVGDFSFGNGRGRSFVFSGSDGTLLHRITGGAGAGVGPGRGAGDVNADGCADLIIGHYTSSDGGNTAGKAVVYSGKDASILMTMTSRVIGSNFGFDAVGIGDVNRDGKIDYIGSAATSNRAYIIAGTVDRPLRLPPGVPALETWGILTLGGLVLLVGLVAARKRLASTGGVKSR